MIAFVIGGSAHVVKEIGEAYSLVANPDLVVVVNDIGASGRIRFDHWVTLHPDNWGRWLVEKGKSDFAFQRWSPLEMVEEKVGHPDTFEPPLNHLPDFDPSGLSGLYAIKVALYCGATHIILVGVPMDQSGHFSGNWRKHWINKKRFRAWYEQYDLLQGKIKSLSGNTRRLFGPPTEEWLSNSQLETMGAKHRSVR